MIVMLGYAAPELSLLTDEMECRRIHRLANDAGSSTHAHARGLVPDQQSAAIEEVNFPDIGNHGLSCCCRIRLLVLHLLENVL